MWGDELEICPVCKRTINRESRSRWDRDVCRMRESRILAFERARAYLSLPLATVPDEVLEQLPVGAEQRWAAYRHVIRGRAPAGAHGYRVATLREGSQTLRCFPPSASRALAVFRLEPFETPVVPMRGRYVVLYFDELGNLIGEPTFTIYIGWRDRDLRLSDGDRTLLPRKRDRRNGRSRLEG